MDTNLIINIAAALLIIFCIITIVIIIKKKKTSKIGVVVKPESLKDKLAKTKNGLLGKLAEIVNLRGRVDDDLMDDLEEMLLQADVGVQTSYDIIDSLKEEIKLKKITAADDIQKLLEEIIRKLLLKDYGRETDHLQYKNIKPFVALFTGVNGVGNKLLLKDYGRETDHLQYKNIKPFVALFTGVNGVGKTTTIAKLAKRFTKSGLIL